MTVRRTLHYTRTDQIGNKEKDIFARHIGFFLLFVGHFGDLQVALLSLRACHQHRGRRVFVGRSAWRPHPQNLSQEGYRPRNEIHSPPNSLDNISRDLMASETSGLLEAEPVSIITAEKNPSDECEFYPISLYEKDSVPVSYTHLTLPTKRIV